MEKIENQCRSTNGRFITVEWDCTTVEHDVITEEIFLNVDRLYFVFVDKVNCNLFF